MTVTLLANQCPAPQCRVAHLSIAAAATGANAPVSTPITAGSPQGFVGKLNQNQTRQDLTGAFGGGGCFVAEGLAVSAGPGLAVSIAPGTAMIDGPVGVDVSQILAVPASSGRVFLWLLQTGLPAYTLGLAPPATSACLLGSCTTSGTAVTSVDTSGVLFGLGILQRTTADAGMPTDTPPTGLHFYTVTKGGTYYWTGTAYVNVAGGVTRVAAANSTLTLGGTSSAPTLALNLDNANTWTAAQSFLTATVSGTFSAATYKVGSLAGITATLTDGTAVTGGPAVVTKVVSLAASTQTFGVAGKNYLVTADFHAVGSFSDVFYESSLTASNTSLTVSPNEAGRTAGAMSWIVYVPSDQTNALANISLTASLRGRGWTGNAITNVAATWTVTQIA